ncbi:hypothetical protein [Streptomyces sp. NPDC048057]|uniref:hypothetical protein n=1 Tax=Streptomyces sp. NPDC048057 TaxID=3155628 RepID=UPI0033C156C3
MRLKALAIAGAAAGALALTGSPASANAFPEVNWKPVNTTSDWTCGPYVGHPLNSGVKSKWCNVLNRFGDAQAVLVVQNSTAAKVYISGTVRSNYGSNVNCAFSAMGAGGTAGCYAPTIRDVTGPLVVNVALTLHI